MADSIMLAAYLPIGNREHLKATLIDRHTVEVAVKAKGREVTIRLPVVALDDWMADATMRIVGLRRG